MGQPGLGSVNLTTPPQVFSGEGLRPVAVAQHALDHERVHIHEADLQQVEGQHAWTVDVKGDRAIGFLSPKQRRDKGDPDVY